MASRDGCSPGQAKMQQADLAYSSRVRIDARDMCAEDFNCELSCKQASSMKAIKYWFLLIEYQPREMTIASPRPSETEDPAPVPSFFVPKWEINTLSTACSLTTTYHISRLIHNWGFFFPVALLQSFKTLIWFILNPFPTLSFGA